MRPRAGLETADGVTRLGLGDAVASRLGCEVVGGADDAATTPIPAIAPGAIWVGVLRRNDCSRTRTTRGKLGVRLPLAHLPRAPECCQPCGLATLQPLRQARG